MSEQITIANYEVFYLDYLEGNLSGEVLAAFELFLEAHPELVIDSEFEALIPEQAVMDPFAKEVLKKDPDLTTSIGLEVGLIAEFEKQLSAADQLILETVKVNRPELIREAKLVALTKLKPDLTQVVDKYALYQKEVAFVAWKTIYRIAAVAAIFILGIVLFMQYNAKTTTTTPTTFAKTEEPNNGITPSKKNSLVTPTNSSNHKLIKHKGRIVKPEKFVATSQHEEKIDTPNPETPVNHPSILPELKENKVIAIVPNSSNNAVLNSSQGSNQDLALAVGKNEAVTPVQYLKNKIEEKLDGQVEFKTGSKNKAEKGFFLKLGSLEISHKKGK